MRILLLSTLTIIFIASGCAAMSSPPIGTAIENIREGSQNTQQDSLTNSLPETLAPNPAIVWHSSYDITFGGIEYLHPFDTAKYSKVYRLLQKRKIANASNTWHPPYPSDAVLKRVHTQKYLDSLHDSNKIAQYTEVKQIAWLPNNIAYNQVVVPARYATSGSILAAELAVKYGSAINLGGGYHHASAQKAEGFCAIADITLAIEHTRDNHTHIKNVMIIDLDAHQGNGHGRDFINADDVYIIDMYHKGIYPNDSVALSGIDLPIPLAPRTEDNAYLSQLDTALKHAFSHFKPDLIVYVAGTDILTKDPLGGLSITQKGIILRDEMIFYAAQQNNVPIVMLLAGGYQKNNARIIADSITNLYNKDLFLPKDHNSSQ